MLTSAGNLLLRRSMEAALYWVIAIQFPIPLLHSHDQEISFDGSPSAHVRRHHGVGDADLGHWHWHCVLPWELGQEGKKPEDRDRLPILCAGSAESIAAIDLRSDIVDVAGLPQLVLPFAMHWAFSRRRPLPTGSQRRIHAFIYACAAMRANWRVIALIKRNCAEL